MLKLQEANLLELGLPLQRNFTDEQLEEARNELKAADADIQRMRDEGLL